MRYLALSLLVLVIAGCESLGPDKGETGYLGAMKTLSVADNATHQITAAWYPNTFLDSLGSFNSSGTRGRLFVTEKKMIFAIYDSTNKGYHQAYEVGFNSIEWASSKSFGAATFLRFSVNKAVHSFNVEPVTGDYSIPRKQDAVVAYILDRVPKRK